MSSIMNARFLQIICRFKNSSANIIANAPAHIRAKQSYAIKINCDASNKSFANTSSDRKQCRQFSTRVLVTLPQLESQRSLSAKAYIVLNEKPVSFEVLLSRLYTNYKQNGYLNYAECQRLIQMLPTIEADAGKQDLTKEQAHFLLGACVPECLPAQTADERLQIFQQIWQYLDRNKQLNVAHYKTHLHMLRDNQIQLLDFRAFLADLLVYDVPDSVYAEVYSALLDVACASGNMRQAAELIAEMRTHNYALNEHNFNALILGHARDHDLNGVQSVLDNMAAGGVNMSMDTFAVLAMAYLENKQTAKALDLLQRFHNQYEARHLLRIMRTAVQVPITTDVLKQLVLELPKDYLNETDVPLGMRSICIELIHQGKLSLVTCIIETLPQPKFNENQNVDSFGVFLLHELFHAQYSEADILKMAQLLYKSNKNMRALHVCTEIALRRQPNLALQFLEKLTQLNDVLRPHYFWPLFVYNVREHGEYGVIMTLRDMQRLKVSIDDETINLYVLPNLWVTFEQPQQALKQLEGCGVRISQIFTPIIMQLLQQQRTLDVETLCKAYPTRMPLEVLVPSLSTLAVHYRTTKNYQKFANLLAILAKKAIDRQYDFIGELLLQMLSPQKRFRDDTTVLLCFINEMSRAGLKVSVDAMETLMSMLSAQDDKDLTMISKAMNKMCDKRLILTTAYENVNNVGMLKSASASTSSLSSFIKHPREMTLDELECHLIELQTKQLNTRGVLRRLLQLCVRDGRYQRALELKAQCDKLNVQTSPGMLASIFDLHIKVEDMTQASATLQQLKQKYPGFKIDEHKLIDYSALMVRHGKLSDAQNLLQQHAATTKIHGGDYVIKNVWNLLNNVAQNAAAAINETVQTKEPKQPEVKPKLLSINTTYEMFKFLRKLGYCNSDNPLLGPIVREWLLRGDLRSAVAEFRRLAEKHKHTPLQFEMLSLLVRLSNGNVEELARYAPITCEEAQQLLIEVTDIIKRVHSPVNMNSALLLAFAESGTNSQLRRLAINPEFCINHDLLLRNCEYLGQEGAVNTLLRLARGVRGLQRVIDEQLIYNMLLAKFAKSNNYQAALDLYERLEADDELKISQQFVHNLVSLLRINNVDIPSSVALRAQIV